MPMPVIAAIWLVLAVALLSPGAAPGEQPAASIDCPVDPLPEAASDRKGSPRFHQAAVIQELRFTLDGRMILAVGEDRVLRAWEIVTGGERFHFRIPKGPLCGRGFLLSPDSRFVVTASDDLYSLLLWNPVTGKLIRRFTNADGGFLWAELSPDGKTLAASAYHHARKQIRLHVWEVPGGRERFNWPVAKTDPASGGIHITPVTFARDGHVVAAFGCNDRYEILTPLWDLDTGKSLPSVPALPSLASMPVLSSDVRCLAVVTDQREGRRRLHLLDVPTGKTLRDLGTAWPSKPPARFSPDGRTLAVIDDKEVRLWDVVRGKRLPTPDAREGSPWDVLFSRDSQTVAIQYRTAIYLCAVSSGRRLHQFNTTASDENGEPPMWRSPFERDQPMIAFSPDDRLLAAPSGHRIRLWAVATGKEVVPGAAK